MSPLEQDITRKRQVDKKIFRLEFNSNDKKYKIKAICNSTFYISKSQGHLPGLYYLVS